MCLGIPGKVVRWIERGSPFAQAEVEFDGLRRVCHLACVPEAEEGDYVNSVLKDDILFSIGNPGALETVLAVDEEFIPLIKPGDKVLITTDAYPGRVFEGKIRVIERESDRVSRTVKVKADTDYPPDIPVGITVEANIVITDREGLFISREAYKDGYVEVMKDGKKVRVPVEPGAEKDGYIEINEGASKNGENANP